MLNSVLSEIRLDTINEFGEMLQSNAETGNYHYFETLSRVIPQGETGRIVRRWIELVSMFDEDVRERTRKLADAAAYDSDMDSMDSDY